MGEHSQSIDKQYGFEYVSRENIRDMRERVNTKLDERNSLEKAIAEAMNPQQMKVGNNRDINILASNTAKRMKHMKVFSVSVSRSRTNKNGLASGLQMP